MESKLKGLSRGGEETTELLIEPVWNRNADFSVDASSKVSF